MRKWIPIVVILIFIDLLIVSVAGSGMMGTGSGGWGPGMGYGAMFDPKTMETVHGEVVSVEQMTPLLGMAPGIHLILKTGEEKLSVHLGPEWFLDRQETRIEPRDSVEVRGSRILFEGKPALIAVSVRKGDEVLILRDDQGVPVWSGWRRAPKSDAQKGLGR